MMTDSDVSRIGAVILARVGSVIREELSRDAYARACVAWFEYDRLKGAEWSASESNRLQDAAHAARPSHVG
jgi:hypothetical protein